MTTSRVVTRAVGILAAVVFLGAGPGSSIGFSMDDVLSAPFVYALTPAPDGSALAFAAHEGGRRNVYYWDGKTTRAITSSTDDDGAGLSELAFVAHRQAVVYVRGGTEDEGEHANPNPSALAAPPQRTIWVAGPGSAPQRIGEGQTPVVSPAGDRVAWINEQTLLSATIAGTGAGVLRIGKTVTLCTSAGKLRDPAFSPDGTRVAFTDDRHDHSFVGSVRIDDAHIVYADAAFAYDSAASWSPDGTSLAFVRQSAAGALDPFLADDVANSPWSVIVADPATGRTRTVFAAPAGRGAAFYSLDGVQQLFWNAAGNALIFPWERDGWRHLYSIATTNSDAQPQLLTPGNFEIETASATPDRSALLVASNERDIDHRHAWRVELDASAATPLTSGTHSQWSPVALGNRAYAYIDAGYALPPAVLSSDNGSITPIGGPVVPAAFPSAALVEPQLVTFRSADGLTIHGQLFVPRTPGAKHPALIFTHGGPMRQMLPGFHYFEPYTNLYESNQYFAAHGFVVLSINYRSGIMYGHDFREADDIGYRGATEYRDVLAGASFLRARADVDARRLGLYGLSYGGYLTALGLARNSDIFAAGVDYAGVHDWTTTLDPAAKGLGTPSERAVAFAASPLAALNTWRAPVLLSQGDDDRNVPFPQGLELARRLHERGVRFEEIVFPNETHENQVHAHTVRLYTAAAVFLERELQAGQP